MKDVHVGCHYLLGTHNNKKLDKNKKEGKANVNKHYVLVNVALMWILFDKKKNRTQKKKVVKLTP